MHVAHLTLHDFRSYADIDVALEPGATAFIGRNGQGKTNLVEAIDYLSRLSSHRVATDAPLVRAGADQAIVRASVVKEGRPALIEVELNPGRANRARINRSPLPRPREIVGLVRTVVFSPDDLTLVKGDPSDRRKFLDDLLILRSPRLAGVRADYDRVLKQRNSLLKTAGVARGSSRDAAMSTLEIWDDNLARVGAEILGARLRLVEDLRPYLGKAYEAVARGASRDDADIDYQASIDLVATGLVLPRPARSRRSRRSRARIRSRPRCSTRSQPGARRSSTAASPSSVRTATSCCSPSATRSCACRSRATPPTGSRGRSRSRCAWRRTTCCAPTATTRSWSSTTSSPSSTPSVASSWRSSSPVPSRCWSPPRSRRTCPRPCRVSATWSRTGR